MVFLFALTGNFFPREVKKWKGAQTQRGRNMPVRPRRGGLARFRCS
nr:MAG TPA: hypothetical protein [Caudoviricetes sp.]